MAGRRPRRPFRRPRVLWLAPLLLTGCDCCEFFQDCPPDWRVSRVALPDTLFAQAEAEFELEARVLEEALRAEHGERYLGRLNQTSGSQPIQSP